MVNARSCFTKSAVRPSTNRKNRIVPSHLTDLSLFPFFRNGCWAAGLLKVGVPKTWGESKKDLGYVRKAGIRQFVSTYNRVKDLKGDELLWGDEIEYGIFHIDPETKKIRLSLRAKEVSRDVNVHLKEMNNFINTTLFHLYLYSYC